MSGLVRAVVEWMNSIVFIGLEAFLLSSPPIRLHWLKLLEEFVNGLKNNRRGIAAALSGKITKEKRDDERNYRQ